MVAPSQRLSRVAAGVPGTAGWRDEAAVGPVPLGVVRSARSAPGILLLDGGDVLARPDFLALLGMVDRPVVVSTTGIALRSPRVLERLRATSGLGLSVCLYSASPACHDWVAGVAEAKSILRGVRAAVSGGLAVHVEIPLVRPGILGLAATVSTLVALGVRSVGFRAVRLEHVAADRRVALGARIRLLARPLAEAGAEALRAGLQVQLRGLPLCAVPVNLQPHVLEEESGTGARCAECTEQCSGLPHSYVQTFGSLELRQSPTGDADTADLEWTAEEDRRAVRRRLVLALERRPAVLRILGDDALAHPDAPDLLREAVRAAPRVEVHADPTPMGRWSDDERHRVRKAHQLGTSA
ncbi:MAG: hypothetical protein KDA24_04325 [Deltaproteobacteria bacterium]|nr:hypothetical protein [Deltaproteobacteria bacterium]